MRTPPFRQRVRVDVEQIGNRSGLDQSWQL
jgi:hypothetical protein